MKKEELLKIFYKYGFHSLNKEPFLYEGDLGIGICYSFKDPFYGNLSRVFIPSNEIEAETFLEQYYWFKKNGSKKNIQIQLSNYKIPNPIISYIQNDKKIDLEQLKNITIEPDEKEIQKNETYLIKMKRTALLLIEIISAKIDIQNTTYLNLLKLTKEYNDKKEQFEQSLANYNHQQYNSKKEIVNEEPIEDYTKTIQEMQAIVQNFRKKEELQDYIKGLTTFLEDLENSDSFIQNKYELIRLPLKIEIIGKKQKYLEEQLHKKRGLFSKKEDIHSAITKIEEESALNNIVSFEHYKENEKERLKEKYSMIPDLDIRTIGDFFIEFDNLSIKEPKVEKAIVENKISYEETMQDLEQKFLSRPKEEKNILILYHSILKKIRIYLETNQILLASSSAEEIIELLTNPNNIMFRIKYFKNINTNSVEECLNSIRLELNKIEKIKSDSLIGEINVFFKGKKRITPQRFIEASNKKVLTPSLELEDNEVTYLATLKKDTEVYFVPTEITNDIESEETLIQKENQPYFYISLTTNKIIEEKNDILKVVSYEMQKKLINNITTVTSLISEKVNQYKKVVIEKRNNNE